MINLNTSALAAGSGSTDHLYPWKWNLCDLDAVAKNDRKVFSCFSCGGGSSMGYKLAGYNVIGNVEIDSRVMEVYKKNNKPKYSFLMDVRDFLKMSNKDLPDELFQLDILDGSPPCSTFSMAGNREKAWGKEKTFREGQKLQTLDDLFFFFIDICNKLKPKVVVAENVSGLLAGNARGYVNDIFRRFSEAGYKTQLFMLNSMYMGVPQKRERCFFIARRKEYLWDDLALKFSEKPIRFGDIRTETGGESPSPRAASLLKKRRYGDKTIATINKREGKGSSGFTISIIWDSDVAPTLTAGNVPYRGIDGLHLSLRDILSVQTFPQDYDFCGQQAGYICGMSVPPVMMAHVAHEIYRQWFEREV